MEKKIKNYTSRNESFNESERSIISYITTSSPDRYNDVVQPSGGDLKSYNKNPVVLFNHSADKIIGKNLWAKVTDTGIVAKTEFAKTPLGDDIMSLYRDGFLSAFSIGFIPKKYAYMDNGGMDITEWELLEYSAVTIPANPEAVALAYKSIKTTELKDLFEKQLQEQKLQDAVTNLEDRLEVMQRDIEEGIIQQIEDVKDEQYNVIEELTEKNKELEEKIQKIFDVNEQNTEMLKIIESKIAKKAITEKEIDEIILRKMNFKKMIKL